VTLATPAATRVTFVTVAVTKVAAARREAASVTFLPPRRDRRRGVD